MFHFMLCFLQGYLRISKKTTDLFFFLLLFTSRYPNISWISADTGLVSIAFCTSRSKYNPVKTFSVNHAWTSDIDIGTVLYTRFSLTTTRALPAAVRNEALRHIQRNRADKSRSGCLSDCKVAFDLKTKWGCFAFNRPTITSSLYFNIFVQIFYDLYSIGD